MSATRPLPLVLYRCCLCRINFLFRTNAHRPTCPSCNHGRALHCARCDNYEPYARGTVAYRQLFNQIHRGSKSVLYCSRCNPALDPTGPGGGAKLRLCGCALVREQGKVWDCWACGTGNWIDKDFSEEGDVCIECGYFRRNNRECGGDGDGCMEVAVWQLASQREFERVVNDMSPELVKRLEGWGMELCQLWVKGDGNGRRSFVEAKREHDGLKGEQRIAINCDDAPPC